MKSKENLVFLGMMGSGKTSIGSMISKKLRLNFFDIDQEIEKKLGIKIPNIFEAKGEKYFRKIEEEITLKILQKRTCVISLGGGGFLNATIRNEVLKNNISIWLSWFDETLIKRIINSNKRPIAQNSTKSQLIELIKKRSNFYSKALYKIDCENCTKKQIVKKVLDIYEKY